MHKPPMETRRVRGRRDEAVPLFRLASWFRSNFAFGLDTADVRLAFDGSHRYELGDVVQLGC